LARFGQALIAVPDALIDLLEQGESRDFKSNEQTKGLLQNGKTLKIVEGPFAGLEARYQIPKGNDRILVLANVLNREAEIMVDINDVARKN